MSLEKMTSRTLTIKVYKSINKSTPAYLNEMLNIQNIQTAYVIKVKP